MDTKTKNQREDELRKSLNYAYLKAGSSQETIDKFKTQATKLLNSIQTSESEEFYKNSLSDFLKDTYYKDKHYINVKDKKDLVIHNDKTVNSSVGVIIEIKRPNNKIEMVSCANLNKKALQELVLYYLRERFADKPNLHIKHLIVTNIYEWFIFDARVFERCFAENKQLVKDFTDFESGTLAGHKTSSFYDDIAKPAIELCKEQLIFTYFNLADYQTLLENTDKENDNQLIPLFKILSPEHLLKLSFSNDANTLNQQFYNELLHIIGVEEIKEGGKKLIKRKEKERHSASFLEQSINNIKNRGEITQEQPLFDTAIALCIIWINRILFLKLLEAQLMTYHKNDKLYQFVNIEKLSCFSDLNHLFFDVLAIKEESRDEDSKKRLSHIPYLNSSLFEETKLENKALDISKLRRLALPILSSTILKNEQGHKLTGELDVLSYLFSFLEAYDFSNDSKEEIKENNKSLITASVLGLIFEKINGYKDGSFFTPSIITMYMSRETMRLAVLQKFNDLKGWQCETFNDLKSMIKIDTKDNRKEANDIVNKIKICDPAVGSGHFLVSVLNEFIAIKSELGILVYHDDTDYTGLSGWKITVDNDELEITLRNNNKIKFEYHIDDKDSQLIQKTLFHEKQKIIENCLFGVDINPNSVEICRLRLWIELLKNAYYKEDGKLETLPNIDINIKIGNSLISRFSLDSDLKTALQRSNTNIEKYKEAFHSYQNAKNKADKKEMEDLIENIKENFCAAAYETNQNKKFLNKKINDKHELTHASLIEETEKEKTAKEKVLQKIENEIARLSSEIENFRNNPLYENAFEWRFEFPEALNDAGDFIGFDVVIGNPPYISAVTMARTDNEKIYFKEKYPCATGAYDIYILFLLKALELISENGVYTWIIPNKFIVADYAKNTKDKLLKNGLLSSIDVSIFNVFESASIYPVIILGKIKGEAKFTEFQLEKYSDLKEKKFQEQSKLKKYKSFSEHGILFSSGATGFEAQKLKELVTEVKTIKTIPFVVSGSIDRYSYNNVNVRFMGLKLKKAFMQNSTKIAVSKWNLWSKEKIIIAGMTKVIEAVYEEKPLALGIGVYAIYNYAGFNPYFLVAILNSKFLSYYINIQSKDKHLAGGYLAINKSTLEKLPLIKPENIIERIISDKSLQIHQEKLQNPKADTKTLEDDIDRLVYALYGLSEAEIAIVQGNE